MDCAVVCRLSSQPGYSPDLTVLVYWKLLQHLRLCTVGTMVSCSCDLFCTTALSWVELHYSKCSSLEA